MFRFIVNPDHTPFDYFADQEGEPVSLHDIFTEDIRPEWPKPDHAALCAFVEDLFVAKGYTHVNTVPALIADDWDVNVFCFTPSGDFIWRKLGAEDVRAEWYAIMRDLFALDGIEEVPITQVK